MSYGRVLIPGTVAVLDIDKSLVYIEDVGLTYAAVVALPEQLPARDAESRALVPGRVGVKKISPFTGQDCVVEDWNDLSERNREFLATFMKLREQHGPNFVDLTPEEAKRMSVRKAGPAPRRANMTPEERDAHKTERRALKKKCATCGERKSKHDETTGHDFTAKAGRVKKEKTGGRVGKSSKFRIKELDLAAAQAKSDKFKPGNRFHRVFLALQSLPSQTGSTEEIIEAVERDGLRAMTDAAKVTRRALTVLAATGNVERL